MGVDGNHAPHAAGTTRGGLASFHMPTLQGFLHAEGGSEDLGGGRPCAKKAREYFPFCSEGRRSR